MALASFPACQGAATEFAQDAPGFELGVGAFARAAQLGVGRLAAFWEAGLFLPLYGVRMWSPAPV
jgi:hypothetical protein